jgi:hypothetical protein
MLFLYFNFIGMRVKIEYMAYNVVRVFKGKLKSQPNKVPDQCVELLFERPSQDV